MKQILMGVPRREIEQRRGGSFSCSKKIDLQVPGGQISEPMLPGRKGGEGEGTACGGETSGDHGILGLDVDRWRLRGLQNSISDRNLSRENRNETRGEGRLSKDFVSALFLPYKTRLLIHAAAVYGNCCCF